MKKIDFAIIITAEKCNPNGDPVNGNMPRQDYDGYGEISDVCIKRKIRDCLQENGEKILVERNDLMNEGMLYSIKDRVNAVPELKHFAKERNSVDFLRFACKNWYDVRAFGQMFPFKGLINSTPINVRGPVSMGIATSLVPVTIMPFGITKTTNLEKSDPGKDKASIATRYIIDRGAYVSYGSISPQLAKKSGFDEKDAEKLKNAIIHMLDNDASSSRPAGSMSSTLFWAEHSTEYGNLPPHKVYELFGIEHSSEYPYFKYVIKHADGIKIEVY